MSIKLEKAPPGGWTDADKVPAKPAVVAITPALGRRILRSAEENGDTLTDLTRLTAMMAVAYQATFTVDEARAASAKIGKQFTAEGELILACDQR